MRRSEELAFTTDDGIELFYRRWPATAVPGGRALVLFHRGHEHSGRLQDLVDSLDLPDLDMFAWDARGHGRSPGPRGFSPSMGTSIRDVETFVRRIGSVHGIPAERIAVVAQSVGSVLAAAWVHDYAPPIRALVLASPAFRVKLYVPLAKPALRLAHTLFGNFFINSYVKSKFLTHDPARQRSYDSDPLITRAISVNVLLGLYDTSVRVVEDAGAIRVPVLLLVSGKDRVVHVAPQMRFFDRLGSADKERHVYPGFYHDTLGEIGRDEPIGTIRDFVARTFEHESRVRSLVDADRGGYTKDEYEALRSPLSPSSPKGIYWALTRAALRFGGLLSDGIRLGWTTGFDSGSSLDYVYRNVPSGRTPLGRLIDRIYLSSPGWRGIRERKRNLERAIGEAVAALRDAGRPIDVVDVAAGHGRYVLEALKPLARSDDRILLRDFSERNVASGRSLIEEKGLGAIARFERGDAFDRASLASLRPRPTLGVVSGLYELFPENGGVRASLAGLADAIEPGGYLVYTGQPWHPQLELIARALVSHRDGAPWVMRRRTQEEMDQLVAEAGFEKLGQRADDEGIFTVSLARRVRA